MNLCLQDSCWQHLGTRGCSLVPRAQAQGLQVPDLIPLDGVPCPCAATCHHPSCVPAVGIPAPPVPEGVARVAVLQGHDTCFVEEVGCQVSQVPGVPGLAGGAAEAVVEVTV